MKKSIGHGVYKDQYGFHIRPRINKRRTWRKLASVTQAEAIKEARGLFTDAERARRGLGRDPFASLKTGTLAELADKYVAAGCPNRKLAQRTPNFLKLETRRIEMLKRHIGDKLAADIRPDTALQYGHKRLAQINNTLDSTKWKRGRNFVDKENQTLSNILNYGTMLGAAEGGVDFNYVRHKPRFQRSEDVRHSIEVKLESGDELHTMADRFFQHERHESTGMQLLFQAMSGCRTNEVLALRTDAGLREPGYIDDRYLYIRRSKGGYNPFVLLTPEFKDLIASWRYWHELRHPDSKWFFPSGNPELKIGNQALYAAMRRVCGELKWKLKTPHGLRAYFVSVQRYLGHSDEKIAAMLGDVTVLLMSTTYGDRRDTEPVSFMPSSGLPAWSRWRPAEEKVVGL